MHETPNLTINWYKLSFQNYDQKPKYLVFWKRWEKKTAQSLNEKDSNAMITISTSVKASKC